MTTLNFFFLLFIFHITSFSSIDCWITKFTTIADASHFYSLENLIGSIHTYAPAHVVIQVGDAGLTLGQRRRLSFYRNVKVSPVEMMSERGRPVAVTDELVDYEKERFISRVNGTQRGMFETWPHIDSIRKEPQLAVVIPFIRSQLSSLADQLNLSSVFTPCRSLAPVDLVFYHNEGRLSSLEWLVLRMIEPYDRIIRRCYGQVRVLAANLAGANDSYPLGSAMMWQKLIDDKDEVSLSSLGYTHFFIMEADASPIRSYWLDAIREQIIEGRTDQHVSTSWWMTGSIYRGSLNIGDGYAHINGNGIYHLSSNFIAFVRFFWQFFLQSGPFGYDYVMTYVLSQNPRHAAVWKSVSHKFRYSDFIQNCWHTGCESNDTKFALDNPQTFLVHGGPPLTTALAKTSLAAPSRLENTLEFNSAVYSTLIFALSALLFFTCAMLVLVNIFRRWKYFSFIYRLPLFHSYFAKRKVRRPIGTSIYR